MKILQHYLRGFILMGFPFGLIMGIFYTIEISSLSGLLSGVYAGLLFGVAMSLILVTLHYVFLLRYRNDEGIDITNFVQQKLLEFDMDSDGVFKKCLKSIGEIANFNIKSSNKQKGLIIAETSTSWKSFGENIELKIGTSNTFGERTFVKIISRPKIKFTIADYGKNIKNIKTISAALLKDSNK